MTRTIEITFAPDGQTRVETQGFVGPQCQAASRFLEQALGQQLQEQRKPEFYQVATVLPQQSAINKF